MVIGHAFGVELSIQNKDRLDEILQMDADYERRAAGLFLDVVFQIHKYLIRLTPEDEGELRGGWTSVLQKYGQDYSRQLRDTALYDLWKAQNVTPYYRAYHFDPSAVVRGSTQSFFEDLPFDVTIINAVKQGEYLEFGTARIPGRHFTELARYKGEFWFNHIFEQWFEKIAKEENIVEPDDQGQNDIPA